MNSMVHLDLDGDFLLATCFKNTKMELQCFVHEKVQMHQIFRIYSGSFKFRKENSFPKIKEINKQF